MADLDIPVFLRLTAEQRKEAWKKFKPVEVKVIAFKSDPRKPASVTDAEWERIKEERRQRTEAPVPAPKKTAQPAMDTTGLRWDARKGKWRKDPYAHLSTPGQPVATVKAPRKALKAVSANSFGIPEGTNRDKLAKAMVKRLGTMVTLKEWSKHVYGKENEGPCFNVMGGFIKDLKTRGLPFEIIRDKDEKDQVTFGLFNLE